MNSKTSSASEFDSSSLVKNVDVLWDELKDWMLGNSQNVDVFNVIAGDDGSGSVVVPRPRKSALVTAQEKNDNEG